MTHFLDKLRAKSPHYRRAIALTVVSAVVGVIFVLWLTALVPKISSSGVGIGQEDSGGTPRPFSALTEQIKRLYGGGVEIITDFVEFGDSIEYVQEKRLPDNLSGSSNSKGVIEGQD